MTITAITCTGDRHEAFRLSERWMAAQTLKPDNWIVLCDGTEPTRCTMGQQFVYRPEFRFRRSLTSKVHHAFSTGLVQTDMAVFWEDDDYYAPEWLEFCADNIKPYDMIGEGRAVYYNVRERYWYQHSNMQHASLCATAVRSTLFPAVIQCCNHDNQFIDGRIWPMQEVTNKHVFDPANTKFKRPLTVGIKGMPGRTGFGIGHGKPDQSARYDPEAIRLTELLGRDAALYMPFYKGAK